MKLVKLLIVAGLAVGGTFSLSAAQTNLVQTLQIRLTAYMQGPLTTNGNVVNSTINKTKFTSDDVIQLLGAATTNSFSAQAHLVIIERLPDGGTTVAVRDGSNTVNVGEFFTHDISDLQVTRGKLNTATGIGSGTQFSYHSFALTNSPTVTLNSHFAVAGLADVTFAGLVNKKGVLIGAVYDYAAAVAGSGDVGGTNALFSGTVSGIGKKVEVIP